jgi:hypothetical protein
MNAKTLSGAGTSRRKFKIQEGKVGLVLWRTINLGRPVIELTSKCELALCSTNPVFDFCHSCHRDSDNQN